MANGGEAEFGLGGLLSFNTFISPLVNHLPSVLA
jgi:hypothetical protein